MPDDLPQTITYGGKLIKDLTDDELWAAIISCGGMDNFRFDKLNDTRINKSNHRLNRIFAANPPTENITFTLLCEALNSEFKLRKLK